MIPALEVKPVCPQCGLALNHFANVDYCPNHGQVGRSYQGHVCEAGCDPRLTVAFGGQRHCNACGKDWLV